MTREDAAKLSAAANRDLAETHIARLSPDTRFDLAYEAIMQCGLLAFMARGTASPRTNLAINEEPVVPERIKRGAPHPDTGSLLPDDPP